MQGERQMIMGELRNRLDRKNELRLYEWMKNADNYGKLQDKTVTEGAEAVSRELDLKVSGSVLTSLVQAMGLDPFWKVRQGNGGSKRGEDTASGLASIQRMLDENRQKLEANAGRLDQHAQCLEQLKAINKNLIDRIERVEAKQGHDRRQRGRINNLDGGENRHRAE
jgi:hypothetical protein